jgi:SprT protein
MTGPVVATLSREQRQRVVEATCATIAQATELFDCGFAEIPVTFELRGRAAGMYVVRDGQRGIRYNPHIFARYFSDNLVNTVPHEVAHYVTDVLYHRCALWPAPRATPWAGVAGGDARLRRGACGDLPL